MAPVQDTVAAEPGIRPQALRARATAAARLRRIVLTAVIGLLLAVLTVVAGRLYERVRLGPADEDTLRLIARDTRAHVDAIAADLRRAAESAAVDPSLLAEAATNPEAARSLFDAARNALRHTRNAPAAITIYGATGVPLAWSGRPSDLPPDRVQGPRALFVAPGPLGPRLVFVDPRITAGAHSRRVGLTAVEQALGTDEAAVRRRSDVAELPTRFVPVSLRLAYERGSGESSPHTFTIDGPDGKPLLEAEVSPAALRSLRARGRAWSVDAALAVLAITLLVMGVPLWDAREHETRTRPFVAATFAIALVIVAARLVLAAAVPDAWTWPSRGSELRGPAVLLFRSPVDLLLTALAALGLVALAGRTVERRRLARRRQVRAVAGPWGTMVFAAVHLAVGVALAALLTSYHRVLDQLFIFSSRSPLQFSLHPVSGERLTFIAALLVLHAAVFWGAVVLLRLASTWWRLQSRRRRWRMVMLLCWIVPTVLLASRWIETPEPSAVWPLAAGATVAALITTRLPWTLPRFRHASQALRLVALFGALALPAIVFYPTLVQLARVATEEMIAHELAPQALAHRSELQVQLRRSLAQIDRLPDLAGLVQAPDAPPAQGPESDRAFFVWSQTDLAARRLTSSIELYGPAGRLVSRFALNLPAGAAATQQWTETSCNWDVFGEPLAGTEDRVLLHAGRGICSEDGAGPPVGAIVVHVMLDYATLPFLSTAAPYSDLFEAGGARTDAYGRPIEFAIYGWGRTPIFATAELAWPISSELLQRIYNRGREPLWEDVTLGEHEYRVFFLNDRPGIYAIGYVKPTWVEHLVAVAEIATLAGVCYAALILVLGSIASLGGHRASTGRAVLREIRRSFYRKLFLAFVAVAVVPGIALALLTRTYVAGELRQGIEAAAGRTASVARRVVESVASEQRRGGGAPPVLTDEIMIWISRVIDEDVNVFDGPRLVATSQRDLFASGLLPTRTPAEVYQAIVLERQAAYVGEERIGQLPAYMLAATPIRDGDVRTILTVPLALRQQEIEREIESLDRRMLLATMCFILIAAAIGYYMAERIADPVSRLTRATRRIARGDLEARILTTSADELRRLVDAFNSMAADLLRQRAELERTNRLAAWADMARQVAHDIKNPLTPVQLAAEHLRRVHEDRGKPLSPVLEGCVETILSQVRLLRQISSEFSSFASSPAARPEQVSLNDVVQEVMKPYVTSLGREIELRLELAPDLPQLMLDPVLVGRALVNLVENALHAMPGGGTLAVSTRRVDGEVRLEVADTGVGMDEAARSRLFEPYFSTRAAGTGLGLTIAKRNVELNRGRIHVESERGRGTTVTLTFPIAGEAPGADTRSSERRD
ncbi:MAG TPA: ATP-binding protein [Vicinamibacterales bacterium]|nr:ATP-binding protein [Vicinamibacterales bacterium]